MPKDPQFTRPNPGYAFNFGGVNVRSRPDHLPPGKFAMAQNIRATSDSSVHTRPGYTQIFATGGNAISDIKSYSTVGTDNFPRFLARDSANKIWLDTGSNVATLATSGVESGVSMVPFRPPASPDTWMYVAGLGDFQKLSAPDGSNVVIAQKVGIAEPLASASFNDVPLQAAPTVPLFSDFSAAAANWTQTGTAGAPADQNLITDTTHETFADPVISTRHSTRIDGSKQYLIGELLTFAGGAKYVVQDVIPPIASGGTIKAIRYYSGTSGKCIIYPSLIPDTFGNITNLRRGAIVFLKATEYVLVLDVISGPDGTVCFETSTSGTFAAADSIAGASTIVVDGTVAASQAVSGAIISSAITTGSGSLSQPLSPNPFLNFQNDDYIHCLIFLVAGTATNITSLTFIFNVSTTVDYVTATYTKAFTGSQLVASGIYNIIELTFPVSSLTPSSTQNPTVSLANCNGVRITTVVSSNTTLEFGMLWVGGGGQPDIGDNGIPYRYRAVPRSSTTGATGNPTPTMRYGVSPRRQSVTVQLPSGAYDSQIDTWDIYRYGGSVTSYRYLGSAAVAAATFTDNFFDDSVTATQPLVTDNFEPWPSVDAPFTVSSASATITVKGFAVDVSGFSGWPSTIANWLPGTLIVISGLTTYTLRARPSLISSTHYLFLLEENAGSMASASLFSVPEPQVANQHLPYAWGPDSAGSLFACGDNQRPGVVYWSKSYSPDQTSNLNQIELSPPSEPLLGGELLQGVALVGSTLRWWALYPTFGASVGYTPVERAIGRALISPFAIATDSARIYFWARDSICSTDGGHYVSLTDADLYNIFPHEGVAGTNVTRNGVTFYAPDYEYVAQFRLCRINDYLYADYRDSTQTARTLVLDLRNNSWSSDSYGTQITVHYGVEQQEGPLATTQAAFPLVALGDTGGFVYKQVDLHNDGTLPIVCTIATPEWDGGDPRSNDLWGDGYLDCIPAGFGSSGVTVLPVAQGSGVASLVTIPISASRQFAPISFGGGVLQTFLGLAIGWADDYLSQSVRTVIFLWQPSFIDQPEIITDRYGDWQGPGGAQYYRGFLLEADTSNASKGFRLRSSDDNSTPGFGPLPVKHNGRQEIAYDFTPPFVSHLLRVESSDQVPWRFFGIRFISDAWPEFQAIDSAWINPSNAQGAKYLLGLVIPLDTGGFPVTLNIKSSEGPSVALGPVATVANIKTPTAFAFTVPLIGHDFQIQPSAPVRLWYEEARWDFDPWPELTAEASPWMDLGVKGAKYIRAIVIPMDTGGFPISLTIKSSAGASITLGPVTTTASVKTPVSFAFVTPLIGAEFQIIPSGNCRTWHSEARWDFDPWPELIAEASPWKNLGTTGTKYLRGAVIPLDTGGASVVIKFISSDGASISLPAITNPSVKTPVAFAFTVPLIGHEFQLVPSIANAVRVWWDDVKWIFDPWPEITPEASAWMNFGRTGAKYLRSVTFPVDTGGLPISFSLISSDGGTFILGPITTPVSKKTDVSFALVPPIVGHEFQIIPSGNCRLWWEEIRPEFDPYPEIIPEYTSIMLLSSPDAKYVQGLKITGDSAGAIVNFLVLYDGGQTGAGFALSFNGKQTKPISWPAFIGHNLQLVPIQPCRIWVEESEWIFQATPDLGSYWQTQFTSHGCPGYHHLGRLEVAYASTAPVTLTILSYDGTSPNTITLPPTSGVEQRTLITPTFNKGSLYKYSAISPSPFQIFIEHWIVYVGAWGRSAEYLAYHNLGDSIGDKARL